jgi:hypothetical protein
MLGKVSSSLIEFEDNAKGSEICSELTLVRGQG